MQPTRKERLARALADVHAAIREEHRCRRKRWHERDLLAPVARERVRRALLHFADVIGSDD